MSLIDFIRLVLFSIHSLAAAAWIGGGAFYLLVVRPSLKAEADSDKPRQLPGLRRNFQDLAETCIILLVVTGVVLVFDRLALNSASPLYAGVLGLKIAFAVWSFLLAAGLRRRSRQPVKPAEIEQRTAKRAGIGAPELIVVLGAIIFLLAATLRLIGEAGMQS